MSDEAGLFNMPENLRNLVEFAQKLIDFSMTLSPGRSQVPTMSHVLILIPTA